MTPLVIGLGNEDRGDDAVGPRIARTVAAAALPGVAVLECDDPTDLVLGWDEHAWVIVTDAVVSGAPAGTVMVAEIADANPAPPSWTRVGLGGTHAFGLAEAVELSRALGRLPARVTLVGVEAAAAAPGADLTAAVARAVPHAAERVLALLTAESVGGVDVPR